MYLIPLILAYLPVKHIIYESESMADFASQGRSKNSVNGYYVGQRLLETTRCRLQGQLAAATSVRFIGSNLPFTYPRRL